MSNQSSIQKIFTINILFTAMFSLGMLSIVWVQDEYATFKADSELLRENYVEKQKSLIKDEVLSVVDYVQYMLGQTEIRLKHSIKEHTVSGHSIASNIYQQNKDIRSSDEIKKMITDALRPIRFNNRRGYYFTFDLNGRAVLFSDKPKVEGKDTISFQGGGGKFVVKDMIDLAKEKEQGFYQYSWSKPGKEGKNHLKIAYVKLFKPYGWVLGTGEYIDDVTSEVQKEVLNRIVNLRFGDEGYFFGSTYQGQPLFSNSKITRGQGSILGLTDPNGVKIIEEYQKAVRDKSGDYINYSWKKLNSSRPSPKISYVHGLPEWEWIIGAGVYLDTIEKTISQNKIALKTGLKDKLFKSVLILLLLFALIFYWARRISNQIQSGIKLFASFFRDAATQSAEINTAELFFLEFREIATFANKMLRDQKLAEDALHENQIIFQSFLENSPVYIFFKDHQIRSLMLSRNYEQLLGMPLENILGRTMDDIFPSDLAKKMIEDDKRILHEGKITNVVEEFDGRIYETTKFPISINNKPNMLAGFTLDITDRKKAEEEKNKLQAQLLHTQKMEAIGTFSGGIAHDFNNILAAILGYADLAKDDIPDWSPAKHQIEEVLKAGNRAKELVKQILAFGRKAKTNRVPVNIELLIKEGLDFLRASIPTTIDIKLNIAPSCGNTLADPTQLHQILMNLCTNAAQAMEEDGGVLNINLSAVDLKIHDLDNKSNLKPGLYVLLVVSDTGTGIEKEHLDRIFDPYFTTKSFGKGSGMGLAVVHGIVHNHGGMITVESFPDQGTTFKLYLPKIEEEVEELGGVDTSPSPLGKEKILIVDDDASIATLTQKRLEMLGYKTTAMTNSKEALELFRAEPNEYDLVITDQTMPNMTGEQLAKELLKIRPDIPIIICTGYSSRIDAEKADSIGIRAFVMKPVDNRELSRMVRRVLDSN